MAAYHLVQHHHQMHPAGLHRALAFNSNNTLALKRTVLRPAGSGSRNSHPRALRWQHQCQRRQYSRSTSFSGGRDVRILEVGPRDGLQNIKTLVPTPTKVELIERLAAAGLRDIEATSFVSPKWVPQLADGAEVMRQIRPLTHAQPGDGDRRFPVLAPNPKGLENAMKSDAKEVVIFASASQAFSKANQNCTVDEALAQAESVARKALPQGIAVRGVVSCIFADPYSGPTKPQEVEYVVKRLLDMGCYEVSLGDTLGVGTPYDTQLLLEYLLRDTPARLLAGHFHDTYGQAVANVARAYDLGLRTFDSSVAGLGGCPYAVGAKGNLATEDIVYMFDRMGVNTGVDLDKLVETGDWISQQLGRPNGSRAGSALVAKAKAGTKAPPTPASTKRTWTLVQDYGDYKVERAGPVVQVTLTRPANGNALTGPMVDGLTALYRSLAQDRTVFHIVLAAEGRFFCTGMDLSGGTETSDTSAADGYFARVSELFRAIDESPQTTIAVVDGPCYAGGVGLSTVCDVRLASSRARWTLSEVKLGLAPAIISKFMVREWGVSFAREAILSGREVHVAELHRLGAVHGLADGSDDLQRLLHGYLDQLRKAAPVAASWCKDLVKVAWALPTSAKQEQLISDKFADMMLPGSEGRHGIAQFQKKVKVVDWVSFWNENKK
ncbi:hydroxymethylglutaryl-CoA lyase [Capronia epimyces CBS 606.96]|uniref:hydroxymethylglutaryl-CoA lyase n=1 Tax=Capronia epimyces CBS 606.96 TaxID=1182542 RepID=W9YY30_9EURO|nr:hydroxymethylglutaryl-CoA lyase [Capronia epimyces CBS 606.96]EXJ87209.1 hydroxymethylglutaryl-CoA lyase [Capronia epimyces CBS 606.96]